jgi:hypothetical protein
MLGNDCAARTEYVAVVAAHRTHRRTHTTTDTTHADDTTTAANKMMIHLLLKYRAVINIL